METQYALLTFGIPVHELPVAMPSNAIKTKNHMKWMKMRYHLEQLIWTHETTQQISSNSNGQNNCSNKDFGRPEKGLDWVKRGNRKRKKMTAPSTQRSPDHIVECPMTTDVLFANGGKSWMKHEGNVQFVQLLEKSIPAYMGYSSPPSPSSSSKASNVEYCQVGAAQLDDSRLDVRQGKVITQGTSLTTKKSIIRDVIDTIRNNGGRFLLWEEEYGWWVILDQQALDVKVRRALLDHNRRLEDRRKNARHTIPPPVEEGATWTGGGGNLDGYQATNRDEEIQCRLNNPSGATGHAYTDQNLTMGPSWGTEDEGFFGCFGSDF